MSPFEGLLRRRRSGGSGVKQRRAPSGRVHVVQARLCLSSKSSAHQTAMRRMPRSRNAGEAAERHWLLTLLETVKLRPSSTWGRSFDGTMVGMQGRPRRRLFIGIVYVYSTLMAPSSVVWVPPGVL